MLGGSQDHKKRDGQGIESPSAWKVQTQMCYKHHKFRLDVGGKVTVIQEPRSLGNEGNEPEINEDRRNWYMMTVKSKPSFQEVGGEGSTCDSKDVRGHLATSKPLSTRVVIGPTAST